LISPDQLHALFASYGVWTVAFIVGLESLGVPLPGETVLILASLYAATHNVPIALVIGAATLGAIVGDNIGYVFGREIGYRLLLRFGPYLGLTEGRIKLGQYLFMKHGGKVVFFGRFVAVLRVLAAFLAGVNRLAWPRFLVANALGGEPIGMPGTARPIALGLPASNAGWHVSAHDLQRHSRRSRRYDRRKVLSEHRRVLSLLVCLRYPRRSP
jgi:membrane protein DedA with SNARE-associated domain